MLRALSESNFEKTIAKIEFLNNILFLTIPFLVAFDSKILFFSVNFVVLSFSFLVSLRNHEVLRSFDKKDFYVRVFIKIIWIIFHLVYFIFYLQQKNILSLHKSILAHLSTAAIILILSGAIIEGISSVIDFVFWLYCVLKILCAPKPVKIALC